MCEQRQLQAILLLAAGLLSLAAPTANAHPDIETQLSILDQRSAGDACDDAVEIRRGELLRTQGKFDAAVAAYDRAAACAPLSIEADLARAELHIQTRHPGAALPYLERALRRDPTSPKALLLRGRAQQALGQFGAAADSFDSALRRIDKPQPEHYLERAHAQIAADRLETALGGLDEALTRLGPVPALVRLRVDLQVERNDFAGALQTLERTRRLPNQEAWLLRRGEVLELARRPDEARDTYDDVLRAMQDRPDQRRQTSAFQALEARARAARVRLAKRD